MTNFSPREIVSELDRYIVGQDDAKRAVAIALRNRWRRQQLDDELRDEVLPKNILMIGPTGVGKTEIARPPGQTRPGPFLKVEATKFTEVGYVGRDVEQIVRDLVEIAIHMVRSRQRKEVEAKAEIAAEERVLDALVGEKASSETRQKFRTLLREGKLDDKEIEIDITDSGSSLAADLRDPRHAGRPDGDGQSRRHLRQGVRRTHHAAQDDGGGFARGAGRRGGRQAARRGRDGARGDRQRRAERHRVPRRDRQDLRPVRPLRRRCQPRGGAGRDLLPLIEGTTVATKHGTVETNHILFVASGAFHLAKPSDLLPELQGRLPIRVELKALTEDDFRRILTEPETSLIRQYVALMGTEDVTLDFAEMRSARSPMSQRRSTGRWRTSARAVCRR